MTETISSQSPGQLVTGSAALTKDQLLTMLDNQGVPYDIFYHKALRTVEEARSVRPKSDYGHTKNLFVRNKKGKMWLLTLHEDRRVDLKLVAQQLGAGRFSFASEDRLMKYLGVIPGAVSAFSILNDELREVEFFVDEALMTHPRWHLHPLDNRATVTLDREVLLAFLHQCGHKYQILPN